MMGPGEVIGIVIGVLVIVSLIVAIAGIVAVIVLFKRCRHKKPRQHPIPVLYKRSYTHNAGEESDTVIIADALGKWAIVLNIIFELCDD